MNKACLCVFILLVLLALCGTSTAQQNYLHYHTQVTECEQHIANKNYHSALSGYKQLFNKYDFIFLNEYKVAAQLSVLLNDKASCIKYIKKGMQGGWQWKAIKKVKLFKPLHKHPLWKDLKSTYKSTRAEYQNHINQDLKEEAQQLFKKDQKMALKYLLKFGQRSKIKYAENKFAPHSEKQLAALLRIFNTYGYPGEKLIGNDWLCSVILSHHNSISISYNSQDTLYTHLRPKIMSALKRGELSPYTMAIFEDWKVAGLSDHSSTKYALLGAIQDRNHLKIVNENRSKLGMRSTQLRNRLIDIEKETRLNLYLPSGWISGKISVVED